MATQKALVLTSFTSPPALQDVPIPKATPGSIVVKNLYSPIYQYMHNVYVSRQRPYPMPLPLVIGAGSVARIHETGPDTITLKKGDLVIADPYIRGRDSPATGLIMGISEGFTENSRRLAAGEWRDSTFAEYTRIPLENVHKLDEARLTGDIAKGGLGYSLADIVPLLHSTVAMGGLNDIDLKVGETVLIAPATGRFGGSAIAVAVAMGAKVIAMGRNEAALTRIAQMTGDITTVPITSDPKHDAAALAKLGRIDVFIDFTPPEAASSHHVSTCIEALRHGGRVSLMGGPRVPVPIPYFSIMHRDIVVRGKWMYERADIERMVGLVESGRLHLGRKGGLDEVVTWSLQRSEEAFVDARKRERFFENVAFAP